MVDETTNTASDCRCRASRIARKRAASLEGRIPKRYRGASFDRPPVLGMPEPVVSAVRGYVRNLNARLDEGRGMWLVGDVGTGKTTLAMIVSGAALEAGYSVAIYSLPRLLNLIRDEIGTDNSLLDLLDRLSSVDLLHIDDLGAQHTTPWRLEQLYSIVDARYQSGRPIVATTNLCPTSSRADGPAILTTVSDGEGKTSEERRWSPTTPVRCGQAHRVAPDRDVRRPACRCSERTSAASCAAHGARPTVSTARTA